MEQEKYKSDTKFKVDSEAFDEDKKDTPIKQAKNNQQKNLLNVMGK